METHAELFLLSLEIVQRYAQPRLIPLLRSVVDRVLSDSEIRSFAPNSE